MMQPSEHSGPFWEHLNIKVQIGTLLFDILLDNTFMPQLLGSGTEKHNHSALEVQIFLAGTGTLAVGEAEYPIAPGSIHLIGPHLFHAIQPNAHDPLSRVSVRFTYHEIQPFAAWYPAVEAEQMKAALDSVAYLQIQSPKQPDILHHLSLIREELVHPTVGTYTNVHSMFAQLLVHLVRAIHLNSEVSGSYKLPSKVKDELRMRTIDTFFSRFKENLSIDMLADHLHLSVKQVNRLLQQYFHTSFKKKLIDTRVEVAKDLLRTGDWPIQRIAEEVGYATAQHFNHVFMQRTGMLPSQYRVSHRERIAASGSS